MSDNIYLVSMPFFPLETPPLGIGQLVAAAKKMGMDVKALHLSLRFAKLVTIQKYRLISEIAGFHNLLGEWVFSGIAYQDFKYSDTNYPKILLEYDHEIRNIFLRFYKQSEAYFIDACHNVRKVAERFIEQMAREIVEHSPRIIGCSTTFQQYSSSLALLRRIKQLNASIVTVLGGAHCEAEMGKELQLPDVHPVW